MAQAKDTVLNLQNELTGILRGGSGMAAIKDAKRLLNDAIETAKRNEDGLTQLYACMVELLIDHFTGEKEELIDTIGKLTKTNIRFILTPEKGKDYPEGTVMLDPDSYGMYYALNDYAQKHWDEKAYHLSKNGDTGNALIAQLMALFVTNDQNELLFTKNHKGETERAVPYQLSGNRARAALIETIRKHDAHIFPNLRLAMVGGEGPAYDITMSLSRLMDKGAFLNYSPFLDLPELNLRQAEKVAAAKGEVDYVITSNVINAFDHHMAHEERDEVWAAAAKILKKGGKAIHLMEKTSKQHHFNVNLNRTMHKAIGQDLVYSFLREKGPMDRRVDKEKELAERIIANPDSAELMIGDEPVHESIRHKFHEGAMMLGMEAAKAAKESSLENNPEYFRTSMLVMYQSQKPLINAATVEKMKEKMNHYQHRFNHYHKNDEVYVARPGEGASRA